MSFLKLKCTKFDFQTPLGELNTALPSPLAGLKGPKGKEGEKGREEWAREGEKRGE